MRNGLFGAILALLAGAGLAAAQPSPPGPPLSPYCVQLPPAAPPGPAPAPQPGHGPEVVPQLVEQPQPAPVPPLPPPVGAWSPDHAPTGAPPTTLPPPVVAWSPDHAIAGPPADDGFRPTQTASAYPYYAWARSEFLLWTIKKGSQPPPLVTTGPSTAANPAVLTDPSTVVLFPTGPVDYHAFEGGRWAVGTWFDPCEECGAEVTGLLLVRRSTTFAAASDANGSPVLGLPFIDAQTGQETVNYAAFPGRFAGGVQTASAARLWGMEGTFYADWWDATAHGAGPFPLGDFRTHVLGGFRYLSLDESFTLTQPSLVLPGGGADFNGAPLMTGDTEIFRDAFATRSQFFGGQAGVRCEFDRGPFYAEFTGKVGLGDSHESVLVHGATALVPAATGVPQVVPGGFLATATNIGQEVRDRFAVVPEVGINVGYQPSPLLRLFVGYTFLYWSDVVRAADQIDRTVNLTAVPSSATFGPLVGPARPAVPFRGTDFWAQGVSFGFELRY